MSQIIILFLFLGSVLGECNYHTIQAAQDTCSFVRENCDPESIIDFNTFYYCTLNQNLGAILPICVSCIVNQILVIVLCFYILGSTADIYLSPALARISKMCKMSENLAGVTLLALGNGAPDVFSSIAATGDIESGVSVAIGALVGSGFFVGNFVFALVILCSKKEIKVERSKFLRDILFYMAGLLLIGSFSLVGHINIFMAISVLLLYIVYVAFIAITEVKQNKRRRAERREREALLSPSSVHSDDKYPNPFESVIATTNKTKSAFSLDTFRRPGDTVLSSDYSQSLEQSFTANSPTNFSPPRLSPDNLSPPPPISPPTQNEELQIVEEEVDPEQRQEGNSLQSSVLFLPLGTRQTSRSSSSLASSIKDNHIRPSHRDTAPPRLKKRQSKIMRSAKKVKNQVAWSLLKAQYWVKNMQDLITVSASSEDVWEKKNCCKKVQFVLLDTPLDFLRRLTIFPFEDEMWSRLFASMVPPCATIFFFFCTQLNTIKIGSVEIWWPLAIVMILPGVLIYCTSHAKNAPPYAKYLAYEAFIMSIVWIWFVANILVDVLQLLGYISGITPAYLALTLLALGNAIGDFVADLAISKMGMGELAVTGCVAGPLFNLLLGMGISLTKSIASAGNINFSKSDADNRAPLGCLVFLLLTYAILIVIISARKFVLPRGAGIFLLITFVLYLCLASFLTFVL